MSSAREDVLAAIDAERTRQDNKWGEKNHPHFDDLFTGAADQWQREELCHNAKLVCDKSVSQHKSGPCWEYILLEEVFEALQETSDGKELYNELIQVAAVATAWAEQLLRQGFSLDKAPTK